MNSEDNSSLQSQFDQEGTIKAPEILTFQESQKRQRDSIYDRTPDQDGAVRLSSAEHTMVKGFYERQREAVAAVQSGTSAASNPLLQVPQPTQRVQQELFGKDKRPDMIKDRDIDKEIFDICHCNIHR